MKTHLLLSLSLLAVFTGCTQKNNSSTADLNNQTGIIGGEAAKADDEVTSSTVSLVINMYGVPYSFCTGTLISKDLVLTATHCLKDLDTSKISVFFGDTLPTSFENENIVKIHGAAIHPKYSFELEPQENVYTGFNDVGVIRLAQDAPAFAKPVPVLNDTPIQSGQILLLAGYGLVDETSNPPQSAKGLNLVHVSIAKTFSNILVTDQNKASGACAGDSGGPAYLETNEGLIVLGITRGPHNRAPDCRHFGEYTYASRFKDFILEKAAELGAEAPIFVDAPEGTLLPEAVDASL